MAFPDLYLHKQPWCQKKKHKLDIYTDIQVRVGGINSDVNPHLRMHVLHGLHFCTLDDTPRSQQRPGSLPNFPWRALEQISTTGTRTLNSCTCSGIKEGTARVTHRPSYSFQKPADWKIPRAAIEAEIAEGVNNDQRGNGFKAGTQVEGRSRITPKTDLLQCSRELLIRILLLTILSQSIRSSTNTSRVKFAWVLETMIDCNERLTLIQRAENASCGN